MSVKNELPLKDILQLEKIWRESNDSVCKKVANQSRREAIENSSREMIRNIKKSLVPVLDENNNETIVKNNNVNNSSDKYAPIDVALVAEVEQLEAELKELVGKVRESRESIPNELHLQTRKKLRLMYSTDRFYTSDDNDQTNEEKIEIPENLKTKLNDGLKAFTPMISKINSQIPKIEKNVEDLKIVLDEHTKPNAIEELLTEK